MSLICLEGASAVGKTSTSREFAKTTNTYTLKWLENNKA